MERNNNYTTVIEIHLIGFPIDGVLGIFLFLLFLVIYIITIIGNVAIMAITIVEPRLHTPMYFFLSNFSFMEIWYTSVTIPKMLRDFLVQDKTISISGCIAQCYFFFLFAAIENYLMAVMAYDRYLAICNPLRYTIIMVPWLCCLLAFGSWVSCIIYSLLPLFSLNKLSFCGPNQINHFFCDVAPLLSLSCTDITSLKLYFFSLAWIMLFSCLLFTIVSYAYILFTIFRISSVSGRQKAFSTCGSHLTVVIINYGAVIYLYVRPTGRQALQSDKVVSVIYSVVTPLLNPIIYSLRNKEVKESLRKALSRRFVVTKQNS
ncbi:olfactory receptor 6F1-like [Rhinatrema bivittatum]|uniref:olfactory receptor 6F1-like n=1 Tax=Rhinatrema bivittatum TaxID=194408 RepID=UPI0011295D6E|nr:olfactory receptor 6F1-like [Rhinatrema bivittatum]